jgi:hypothetical protein
MHKAILLASTLLLFTVSAGYSQETEAIRDRLSQLESETARLRSDIQAYGSTVERLPPVEPMGRSEPVAWQTPSAQPTPDSTVSPAPSEFTLPELQSEMQKLSWSKGPFKFTVYGRLWASGSYDTQRTQVGDYVLWVDSPDTRSGEEAQIDIRSTRLGCDIGGPAIACMGDAKVGGKVEIDFQGIYLQKNEASILLRHAYAEIKNDDYRILAGQTWDVISPLYTPTFNYTVGSAAGNLAYRRAQFRLERFLPYSEEFLITLQTAAAVDILVPQPSSTRVFGYHSGWPDWQNRVAFTFGDRKAKDAHPVEIGVSGHVGEQRYDVLPLVGPQLHNIERPSWSLSVDAKVPLTKTFGVQGEVFTGSNLSNYFGGIMQGIDPVTLDPIRDSGGWVDIWYDMRPDLHWNVGYSIDDPLDEDMTTGRLYNQYLFANFVYDFSKFLNAGLEVASWKTLFVGQSPGEAMRLEAIVRYNF